MDIDSYLISNVNVIPMNRDTVLKDRTVYIKDGMVKAIQETVEAENIQVINGENKYLMPGLVDMHVHVWDKYELGLYLANGVIAIRNV